MFLTAKASVLKEIEALEDVARVRPEVAYPLVSYLVEETSDVDSTDDESNWHMDDVNLAEAWAYSRGEGVTIGTLDGGARYTHHALARSYRGAATNNFGRTAPQHDYNWLDVVDGHPEPRDVLGGLGTQMLSVAVGGPSSALGIAPGASWFAASTCDYQYTCLERHVMVGVQFLLCPTRRNGRDADCKRGADIVLTAWGGVAGDATVRHIFNVFNMTGMKKDCERTD